MDAISLSGVLFGKDWQESSDHTNKIVISTAKKQKWEQQKLEKFYPDGSTKITKIWSAIFPLWYIKSLGCLV